MNTDVVLQVVKKAPLVLRAGGAALAVEQYAVVQKYGATCLTRQADGKTFDWREPNAGERWERFEQAWAQKHEGQAQTRRSKRARRRARGVR